MDDGIPARPVKMSIVNGVSKETVLTTEMDNIEAKNAHVMKWATR